MRADTVFKINLDLLFCFSRKTLAQGRLVNDSGGPTGKPRGVLAHGIGKVLKLEQPKMSKFL